MIKLEKFLILIFLTILEAFLTYTFILTRGINTQAISQLQNAQEASALFYPLVGLWAFCLLWFQFILGSSANLTRKFFPVTSFHRKFGVFAFILVFLHPLFLVLGTGAGNFIGYKFLPSNLRFWALLGTTGFLVLILTFLTAILATRISFLKS